MQIKVRAMPAPGHRFRRRAGLAFTTDWTSLEVAKSPSGDGQISEAQYAQIVEDPHLFALPAGADEAVVLEAAGEVAKKDAEIAKLKKQLAEAAEIFEEHKRRGEAMADEAAKKIALLEAENEQLRADIAKAKPKK